MTTPGASGEWDDVEKGGDAQVSGTKGSFLPPPTAAQAKCAMDDIKLILRPPQKKGPGYVDPKLDLLLRGRLEAMRQFLWSYINPQSVTCGNWITSSLHTANALERQPNHARSLRRWCRAFIHDRKNLPVNNYGKWNESMLEKDELLAHDIHIHLQSVGKFVKAEDLVDYLDTPDMRARTGLTRRLSVSTAQRWMKMIGYRWSKDPKGQFVDGHERADVVAYRKNIFVPKWTMVKENL